MPKLPRVLLALDVATVCGWAVGQFSDVRPRCGQWRLPTAAPNKMVLGARMVALENTLCRFLRSEGVELVVIADRFVGRSKGAIRNSFGLDAAVEAECTRAGVRLVVHSEQTVRLDMHGRQKKGTDFKQLAKDWAALQGIHTASHDAAEAALLWRWTRDEYARQSAKAAGTSPELMKALTILLNK